MLIYLSLYWQNAILYGIITLLSIGMVCTIICGFIMIKSVMKELDERDKFHKKIDAITTKEEWLELKELYDNNIRKNYKKQYVEHELSGTTTARLLNKAEELFR
jgi:hypothetical protein